MFERPDRITSPLYVVTSLFNPIRFRSRWRLYQDFARMCEKAGVPLYTVEIAFGERAFVLPESPYNLRLVSHHELWLKENALNLVVQRLPQDWKYVAWIDADVNFAREDWMDETVHQLQHYDVVQMWSEAVDLTPERTILQTFKSYLWSQNNPDKVQALMPSSKYMQANTARSLAAPGGYALPPGGLSVRRAPVNWDYLWHPGFAWAMRRSAFESVGGLIDWAIIGDGDRLMAGAFSGKTMDAAHLGKTGQRWYRSWEARAHHHIQANAGYVDGLLMHNWHGPKVNRMYENRYKFLTAAGFDPEHHLKRDWQGLWQIHNNPKLRDGLRTYFRQRNEDAL